MTLCTKAICVRYAADQAFCHEVRPLAQSSRAYHAGRGCVGFLSPLMGLGSAVRDSGLSCSSSGWSALTFRQGRYLTVCFQARSCGPAIGAPRALTLPRHRDDCCCEGVRGAIADRPLRRPDSGARHRLALGLLVSPNPPRLPVASRPRVRTPAHPRVGGPRPQSAAGGGGAVVADSAGTFCALRRRTNLMSATLDLGTPAPAHCRSSPAVCLIGVQVRERTAIVGPAPARARPAVEPKPRRPGRWPRPHAFLRRAVVGQPGSCGGSSSVGRNYPVTLPRPTSTHAVAATTTVCGWAGAGNCSWRPRRPARDPRR